MGFGGISPLSLIIILLIVLLLFGSKKIPGLSRDLGSAIKNFRRGLKEDDTPRDSDDTPPAAGSDKPR